MSAAMTDAAAPSLHFNGLTPAEAERLALLLEELGEAQQCIGKILRHGFESTNPHDPDSLTNRAELETELAHVSAATRLMLKAGDLDGDHMEVCVELKLEKVKQWLHHQ